MFIAKNNDLIILINNSREELERQLKFIVYTSVEETDVEYTLVNGTYVPVNTAITVRREERLVENTNRANEAIANGYIEYKGAQFETNAQTVGDMVATRDLMKEKGIETWEWLSKDDKVVELSLDDFVEIGILVATYKGTVWNVKYTYFKSQLEEAQTLEEINAVEIDYSIQY